MCVIATLVYLVESTCETSLALHAWHSRWVPRAYALSVQHKRDSGCSCVTFLHTYIHMYVRVHCYAQLYYWKLTWQITDILYLQLKCMSWMFAIFLCESDLKATIHPCTHIHYTNKMSTLDPDTISTPPNCSTHTAYLCRSPSSSTNTKEKVGTLVLPICIAMYNYTTDTTRCAFGGTVALWYECITLVG